MKKIFLAFILSLFMATLLPATVLADGMVIPPDNYYIYETQQQAVIFYENGLEDLVLSIQFQGNAKNFAWIVPTPNRPEVTKTTDELFTALEDLTRVNYYYDEVQPMGLGAKSGVVYDEAVTIVETKRIDYYDITVLASTDAGALSKWLNDHGYKFPENSSYLLEDYIKNKWYFTAIKVDADYTSDNVNLQLQSGHAIPLRLTFATPKMVFPLKISQTVKRTSSTIREMDAAMMPDAMPKGGVTDQAYVETSYADRYYPSSVGITLYIFSDHKQTLPGWQTLYAGKVSKEEIEKLAFNDDMKPWKTVSQEKYYLTKLQTQMSPSRMTNDLYPRQADNDDTVNAPMESGHSSKVALGVILSIGGLLTLVLISLFIWLIIKK